MWYTIAGVVIKPHEVAFEEGEACSNILCYKNEIWVRKINKETNKKKKEKKTKNKTKQKKKTNKKQKKTKTKTLWWPL